MMETKELEKEFLSMIEEQKRTIYKVCYMYANDQDDLNDLFQETVLNLWKSFPRYRGDSKFNTWVYRIAMNTCITFLRRSNARPQTVPMTAQVASCLEADEETTSQLRELYKLINQLGKLERALILLWLEERNYQEMADILGISKANVAVKLNRIREKLKRMSNS
jgi:RNA polymerase sigma-70 factor (ECF subfamily)